MATIGYTADDPANAGIHASSGYRSHSVARKAEAGNNQFLRGADVSYNGFVFPPQTKCKVTVVQEYTKDQRAVKYLTVALTIEAIITPYSETVVPGANSPGITLDDDMESIKERLSQPCQILSFNLQGFGNFFVQGVPSHVSGYSLGDSVFDVDYGPRPQVLDWEPIAGSIAARIQWLVVTRIPACSSKLGNEGVLDFTYEMAWNIDDAGFFSRTVTGTIEVARTRPANEGGVDAGTSINLATDIGFYDRMVKGLTDVFPILGGFTRNESFKLESNKKFFSFTFTDTEIPSPTPIPHGALNIQMSESLSSALGGGSFEKWNWAFSGSVNVYNSKAPGQDITQNKRLVFDAFFIILHDRLSRVRAQVVKTKNSSKKTTFTRVAYAIPSSIQISSEIFGTGMSFNITYNLICPPGTLLEATGMFDAVRSINSGVYTWDSWRAHYVDSGTRLRYPNIIPGVDAVVDLCHDPNLVPTSTKSPKRDPYRYNPKRNVIPYRSERPSPEESWIGYKNQFKIETSYNTTAAVLLSQNAQEVYPAISNDPVNQTALVAVPPAPPSSGSGSGSGSGGGGNGTGTQSSYLAPDLQTAAHPTTIITLVGGAERIGYQINPPELKSVGGRAVVKCGTDMIIPSERSSGFTEGGALVNIHRCLWRKSYILTGVPVQSGDAMWGMESDGHPQEFV